MSSIFSHLVFLIFLSVARELNRFTAIDTFYIGTWHLFSGKMRSRWNNEATIQAYSEPCSHGVDAREYQSIGHSGHYWIFYYYFFSISIATKKKLTHARNWIKLMKTIERELKWEPSWARANRVKSNCCMRWMLLVYHNPLLIHSMMPWHEVNAHNSNSNTNPSCP